MIRIILTAVLILLNSTLYSQKAKKNEKQVDIKVTIHDIITDNKGIVNFAIKKKIS